MWSLAATEEAIFSPHYLSPMTDHFVRSTFLVGSVAQAAKNGLAYGAPLDDGVLAAGGISAVFGLAGTAVGMGSTPAAKEVGRRLTARALLRGGTREQNLRNAKIINVIEPSVDVLGNAISGLVGNAGSLVWW